MAKKKKEIKKESSPERKKAYGLLIDFMNSHPDVHGRLWAEACMSIFMHAAFRSQMTVDQFNVEMENVMNHYKASWDLHEKAVSAVQPDKNNLL